MTPWIVDAKDIDIEDLDNFRGSLLHSNGQINRFLRPTSKHEVLVVAPKGFGKTLLLKVKRKSLTGAGYTLLPVNAMVDKPIGTPQIFSTREFHDLVEGDDYWRHAWTIALTLSILKFLKIPLKNLSPSLKSIADNTAISSACDIFDRVLSMSRNEYFKTYDDLRRELIPNFRNVHTPIALFVDNIDEYFESAISVGEDGRSIHNIRKNFWYSAQLGLAEAARELNSINNHIKICASVRQEVFQTMKNTDPMALQLRGSSVQLEYEYCDIVGILKKNLLAEPIENCSYPYSPDPYERFFGVGRTNVEHHYTGEDETIEEFWLRHTLLRPRDIAAIGMRVSEIEPSRRSPAKIRETINNAATFIAQTYLAESRPHISNLQENILFQLLPANVLTRKQIEQISLEYDQKLNAGKSDKLPESNHVFCQLYRLGLLGHVVRAKKGNYHTQVFPLPGQQPLEVDGIVPMAETYLIHPVLYDMISRYNSDFFANLDSLNIVGNGRTWRAPTEISFVLKGDVRGYSKIMANADLADKFPSLFHNAVSDAAQRLSYFNVEGGDSFLLVDRNPSNLLAAASFLQEAMLRSIFQCKIRIGGDAGILRFDTSNGGWTNLRGGSLRTAARLEGIGIPGEILLTDRFLEHSRSIEMKLDYEIVKPDQLPGARVVGEMFNLAKNDSEEPILHKVFRWIRGDIPIRTVK